MAITLDSVMLTTLAWLVLLISLLVLWRKERIRRVTR